MPVHDHDRTDRASNRHVDTQPYRGTKGFLYGEQYASCLALFVDVDVELGVIGCSNLLVSASNPDGPQGCLFVAMRRLDACQLPLDNPLEGGRADQADGLRSMLETLKRLPSVENVYSELSFNQGAGPTLN